MLDKSESKIKFDIAYNFDKKLLEEITKYNFVSWVYGKMREDIVGGGRPSMDLPDLSWEDLSEHINLCHKSNIKFNYLLNALCLGNNEFVKDHHKNILKLLDKISELDVDGVTVGSPYLCELIKKQYPHLMVSITVNVRIKSLQQINYWESFGADEITLDQIVNRNFGLLKDILKYTKHSGTGIRLIANNLCLHDCPIRIHHGLANSHASQAGHYSTGSHIHYQYYRCTYLKMLNPIKMIAATWIRPDDLRYYNRIMQETENSNLTMKLVERGSNTSYLGKLLKAYSEQHYDGNLMDLIYAIQNKYFMSDNNNKNMFSERIAQGDYNIKSIRKLKDLYDLDWFYIDNRKLDGYLEKFFNNYSCENMICDDSGWGNGDSGNTDTFKRCSYCSHWAKKAITIDEEKRRKYIYNLKSFLDDLTTSKVFNL